MSAPSDKEVRQVQKCSLEYYGEWEGSEGGVLKVLTVNWPLLRATGLQSNRGEVIQ